MKNASPLLSICIPTYNRASYLEATLESLTNQAVFQNTRDVEIVISDNFSTDETPSVISAFQKKYPDKISARRQASLIEPSSNFAEVLEAGRGLLRKLHNDTLRVHNGFLEECLNLIREYQSTKPLIFFINGRHFQRNPGRLTPCRDLDAFLGRVSFYSGWIGGFSLWDEDVSAYAPVFRAAAHHFAQTEILFRAISDGREALVYNPEFAQVGYDAPKGSPEGVHKPHSTKEALRTVFFGEYTPLFRGAAARGQISAKVERREMLRFCLVHYVPTYHRLSGKKFSRDFYCDFQFLKSYLPALYYHFTRGYYLLFCLFYKILIPHKKIIKQFF